MRCFVNKYPDYTPEKNVAIDLPQLKTRALETIQLCSENFPPSHENHDGGLYVGFIGVGYALVHLANNPVFAAERNQLLKRARNLLEKELEFVGSERHARPDTKLAFILGHPGVYVAGALIYHNLEMQRERDSMIEQYTRLAASYFPLVVQRHGSDELFVGRAGYLCGLVALRRIMGKEVVEDQVTQQLCDAVVTSGRQYAARVHSPSPLMYAYHGTEYLGAAHGLASILYVLMHFPTYLAAQPDAAQVVKASVDYMLSVTPAGSGNLPSATDELQHNSRRSAADELVHWCHGAAGAVYTYVRAYLVWREQRYLDACRQCADVVWTKGLLRKGPGICHGVSGSGYVFLLLHRLTGEPLYLHRATAFADFLTTDQFKREARTPDTPYSLYEGLAGTACFLGDLTDPGAAHFPFMDVFD